MLGVLESELQIGSLAMIATKHEANGPDLWIRQAFKSMPVLPQHEKEG